MRFSTFVDVFVAALYNETQLTGRTSFQIKDIVKTYGLSLNPSWRDTLFKDYTFSSRVDASRRHLGPTEDQHISLSPDGLRWVEDELGEDVATFLEQHGALHETQRIEQLSDERIRDPQPAVENGGQSIESSSWTGLPRSGILSSEASLRLLAALEVADKALDISQATNEERAQARAYLVAIQALAEAPEPPADLIWQLISRANSVAGIASFFIALVALFSHA